MPRNVMTEKAYRVGGGHSGREGPDYVEFVGEDKDFVGNMLIDRKSMKVKEYKSYVFRQFG